MRVEFFAVDAPPSDGPFWIVTLRFAPETHNELVVLMEQCLTLLTNAGWPFGFVVHKVDTLLRSALEQGEDRQGGSPRLSWASSAAKRRGRATPSTAAATDAVVQVYAQCVARPIRMEPREEEDPLRVASNIIEAAPDARWIELYTQPWRADFDTRAQWGTRTHGWALGHMGRSDPTRVTSKELEKMDELHANGHLV